MRRPSRHGAGRGGEREKKERPSASTPGLTPRRGPAYRLAHWPGRLLAAGDWLPARCPRLPPPVNR